ncbi:MAG: DUF4249 family protein [Bacteroidota bacterium]
MKGIALLCLFLAAVSCTEEVDWELNYQEEDLIVVEGKITNEAGRHEVRLTRPLYERNGVTEGISGALVEIFDGRTQYPLREDPSRPGVYLTSPDFAGEVDKGYQLRIIEGGRLITGVSFMRAVSPFQYMRPYRVQADPPLYEVHIADSDGPAIVRLELDWSHVPGYGTLPAEETHALIYHYTLGSIDVNRFFPPDREHVRFPPGTIVFREKESVNGLYEEFLRGMLSETDWRGGVFDVLPGNARTNLSEGAIGYFTASEVIRDTVVID